MVFPEGSLTLHGFTLLPEHLEILASLQERFYAAEAESRKARPVVKAGIRREGRTSIQSLQEKKDGKKLSTSQKTALAKAVEKWFVLFCKKRTSKEKTGTRNYSGRDVFRIENQKALEQLVSEMMVQEGAGKERYVEFYQKGLSVMMNDLSEDELQEYAAKAAVWSNMGPPYEIRLQRGKDIYHKRSHAHARDMYRQGLIRIFSYIAWQTEDGEIWSSKMDFNNEFDGVPRFLDLKKEEIAASGMDALWNDYVMTVYPTDGGDTLRQPHTKGNRKARLLLELNRYGEPVLPNPRQPPFGLKGRPWRVDLARAYFSHWYARAKDTISPHVTVPWSKIVPRLSDFIAPIYLPPNLVKGFLEPSVMIDADVLAVLEHIYNRQEAGEDPPFEFHQYLDAGKVVARKGRRVLKDSEMDIVLGQASHAGADEEDDKEGISDTKKGKGKRKGKGKGKRTGKDQEGEQELDDSEKTRLSAGPSKAKGNGKGKGSRAAKGKARQADPPSDGEYIDIENISDSPPEHTQTSPKPGPSRLPTKPRTVSGSSTRSVQSDASSDAPRPSTPTLVWSRSKKTAEKSQPPASTEPPAVSPRPASVKPPTPPVPSPAKQEPSPQPNLSAAQPSTSHPLNPEGMVVFGSPDADSQFTFKPRSVFQGNEEQEQPPGEDQEPVDVRVQLQNGNRYTLGSSPTPAPKSIQRFRFKPPVVQIPPFPSLRQTLANASSSQVPAQEIEDDNLSGYIPGPKSRWKTKDSPAKQSNRKPPASSHDKSSGSGTRGSGDQEATSRGDRGFGYEGDVPSSKKDEPPKKKRKVGGVGGLPTITEREEGDQHTRDRPKPRPRVVQPTEGDAFDMPRKGRSKGRLPETPRRNTSTRSFAGPSNSTRSKTSMKNKR